MKTSRLISPGGHCAAEWTLDGGRLYYRPFRQDVPVLDRSPLGLVLTDADLSGGIRFISETRGMMDETYAMPAFKKSECFNRCALLEAVFAAHGRTLRLQMRAYEDGVAVRLLADGAGQYAVQAETTAFTVPESARQVIAMKHVASYEDHYDPVPFSELWQNRLALPVLVQRDENLWALCTEAAVFGDYGGSSVIGSREQPRLLGFLRAEDQLAPTVGRYPLQTPWRVVMMGALSDIVESNLLENLNPPSIVTDPGFIRPGVSAWSWMSENDSVTDIRRIREYVDYASKMGFPYYLLDWGWPGVINVPELIAYAAERNVRIWVWEHSADVRDPVIAEQKLRLWASWGVAGVKIDFFESDGQPRMAEFARLAELGAKYRLMMNFHGCTKPAGESRTWPHVLTREGVQGAEYLQNFSTFTPMGPDAAHNCTLPFTRNAVGPMDYTPVMYRTYRTGTTDAHQTALTVVFSSYILHIGERAEYVMESPFRPFLEQVKTAWDETRLLEGYPGSHVTVARRSGGEWYLGGICARKPRNASVSFAFLGDGLWDATLYADDLSDLRPFDVAVGSLPPADQAACNAILAERMRPSIHSHDLHLMKVETFPVTANDRREIPLAVNGGFVMRIVRRDA